MWANIIFREPEQVENKTCTSQRPWNSLMKNSSLQLKGSWPRSYIHSMKGLDSFCYTVPRSKSNLGRKRNRLAHRYGTHAAMILKYVSGSERSLSQTSPERLLQHFQWSLILSDFSLPPKEDFFWLIWLPHHSKWTSSTKKQKQTHFSCTNVWFLSISLEE